MMLNNHLDAYRKKRDFQSTPEPRGKNGFKYTHHPIFVVQQHAASHMHFDFRLEIDGVLKSWAIPKGPSISHRDKRLAIQTEDHPLEYQNFEGVIPDGHYGAGVVIVWDKGHFEHQSTGSSLLDEFNNGHLIITLHGKKLKGGYILQRFRKSNPTQWLFIKLKDMYDKSNAHIMKNERSVISGLTIKELGAKSS